MGAESEWELIKQDRFEEAIQRIDEIYAKTQNEAPLRNKVLALFLLKRQPQPILHEREMCSTCFWVAVTVSRDDEVRSLDLLRKAITFSPSAYLEYEYYLAKGEISSPLSADKSLR